MKKARRRVTPWFPSSIKPVRAGLYEVQDHTMSCNCCWFTARWDGKEWFSNLHSPPGRYTTHLFGDVKRWRGIPAPAPVTSRVRAVPKAKLRRLLAWA